MYFFHRRECSLDRDIAASGYTKEMQEDGELFYPPSCDEDDNRTEVFVEGAENKLIFLSRDKENSADFMYEVSDFSESRTFNNFLRSNEETDSTQISENTQMLNMSDLCSALENSEDEDNSAIIFFKGKSITEDDAEVENQTGQGECCNYKEDEDKCPDLVDLSTLNKKFRHYR